MEDSKGHCPVILLSFGTRPEWIKIKPLFRLLNKQVSCKLLFTGQHIDLLSKLEEDVELMKLEVRSGSNRLDSIVSSIMNNEEIFEGVTSVLVQGDTTSAFSVALAAFHRKIKVIHLEAGLRTYDKKQPYPEEFNRQAISRIADIHLCPTELAKSFLVKENVEGIKEVVGNTVLDNLKDIKTEYTNKIIITMHRRENHETLKSWFLELNTLAKNNQDYEFIFPLHPNPNVQKYKNLLNNISVVEPMEYDDFIKVLSKTRMVITDSGGLQEETSFLGKKCIVCREKTERTESLNVFSYLCKSPDQLNSVFEKVNGDHIPKGQCPFGDGNASSKICEILKHEL
jgi:UDP-N-acetylglucosamine 2-epimerase (non-hydrolysing)